MDAFLKSKTNTSMKSEEEKPQAKPEAAVEEKAKETSKLRAHSCVYRGEKAFTGHRGCKCRGSR